MYEKHVNFLRKISFAQELLERITALEQKVAGGGGGSGAPAPAAPEVWTLDGFGMFGGRPEKDLVWVGSYKNAYAGDMLLLILDPSWIWTNRFEWDAQNFIVFSWCLWAHEPTDRGSQKVGLSRSTRNYLTKDSTIVKPFFQKELSIFHVTLQIVCLKER